MTRPLACPISLVLQQILDQPGLFDSATFCRQLTPSQPNDASSPDTNTCWATHRPGLGKTEGQGRQENCAVRYPNKWQQIPAPPEVRDAKLLSELWGHGEMDGWLEAKHWLVFVAFLVPIHKGIYWLSGLQTGTKWQGKCLEDGTWKTICLPCVPIMALVFLNVHKRVYWSR